MGAVEEGKLDYEVAEQIGFAIGEAISNITADGEMPDMGQVMEGLGQ